MQILWALLKICWDFKYYNSIVNHIVMYTIIIMDFKGSLYCVDLQIKNFLWVNHHFQKRSLNFDEDKDFFAKSWILFFFLLQQVNCLVSIHSVWIVNLNLLDAIHQGRPHPEVFIFHFCFLHMIKLMNQTTFSGAFLKCPLTIVI